MVIIVIKIEYLTEFLLYESYHIQNLLDCKISRFLSILVGAYPHGMVVSDHPISILMPFYLDRFVISWYSLYIIKNDNNLDIYGDTTWLKVTKNDLSLENGI